MGLDCGIYLVIPSKSGGKYHSIDLCYMRKCYRLSQNMFDCVTDKYRAFEDCENPTPYDISYSYVNRRFIAAELFEDMLVEVDKEIEYMDTEMRRSGTTNWLDTDSIWDAGVYVRYIHKVRLELQSLIYWLEGKISLEMLFDIAGQDYTDEEDFDLENMRVTFYYSY